MLLRASAIVFFAGAVAVMSSNAATPDDQAAGVTATPTCYARAAHAGGVPITWLTAPQPDATTVDRWCRAVGPPLVVQTSRTAHENPPALDELVVITWNAHLGEGRLADLIARLKEGRFTGGVPVRHFVLLLQELYRRGREVPAFAGDARAAYAITARDADAPDAGDHAASLGLSLVYVPSMRNGADLLEDRGNAIVSSEPLRDVFAAELPFERQRRVAVGAIVDVQTAGGAAPLFLLNAHLEPLSAPSSLWVFRNPRRRQVAALLDLVQRRSDAAPAAAGYVLGGDFNTIQGGAHEDAYLQARAWSISLVDEDPRSTHHMGRLDYLFFRLAGGWTATTQRLDDRFGSDHFPVVGRFRRES